MRLWIDCARSSRSDRSMTRGRSPMLERHGANDDLRRTEVRVRPAVDGDESRTIHDAVRRAKWKCMRLKRSARRNDDHRRNNDERVMEKGPNAGLVAGQNEVP